MTGIDLHEFRELIGHNKTLEKNLFADFIATSESNLAVMQISIQQDDREIWTKNVHMMKGACRNLGASQLADLLAKAESCPENQKTVLYRDILEQFKVVKDYLLQQSS